MHHQFFQVSPMKLFPPLGALLLSSALVQAFETLTEVDEATFEEIETACGETTKKTTAPDSCRQTRP